MFEDWTDTGEFVDISERELEDICVALSMYRGRDNKYTLWGSVIASQIFKEFQETGGVTFHVVPSKEKN